MADLTSEDIAVGIAAHFTALEAKPIEYAAEVPDDVATCEFEQPTHKVFVLPFSESEEVIDQFGSDCKAERVVSVIFNGPLGGMTRAQAIAIVGELRASLRGTKFGRYLFSGIETVSLFDHALLEKGHFLSLFRVTYFDLN